MLPIILASTSSYRCSLLQKLQLSFTAMAPSTDETPYPNESAKRLVRRLAQEKAQSLQDSFPNHLIIGSDQACVIDNTILGKPYHFANAYQQLQKSSGKKVTFYTGIALLNSQVNRIQVHVETFNVYFRILSHEHITHYLNCEQPFNCAGSFKCEGVGIALFEKLEGRDPTSLVGLPLITLTDMLVKEGIDPLLEAVIDYRK